MTHIFDYFYQPPPPHPDIGCEIFCVQEYKIIMFYLAYNDIFIPSIINVGTIEMIKKYKKYVDS